MPKKRPKTLDQTIIIKDPNRKGGVRVYDKKKYKKMQKLAKERAIDPNDPFGKGAKRTPCKSNPPCKEDHNSKEEANFCFELSQILTNQPENWHFEVAGSKIDYFFDKSVFIEYKSYFLVSKPPKENQILKDKKIIQDKKKEGKILEYIQQRRELIEKTKYKQFPLIVINLKSSIVPENLPENTFYVTQIDKLIDVLEDLEIIE